MSRIAGLIAVALSAVVMASENAEVKAANPYLAFLPSTVEPDYKYWKAKIAEQGQARSAAMQTLHKFSLPATFNASGNNTSFESADVLSGFATDENNFALISGVLKQQQKPTVPGDEPLTVNVVSEEENGSTIHAQVVPVPAVGGVTSISGEIGDGAYGSGAAGSGDFDFYRLDNVQSGVTLTFDIEAESTGSDLDSYLTLYNQNGQAIASDDDGGINYDSLLQYRFTVTGTYYIEVKSYNTDQLNVTDPASGNGAGSEGPYRLTITHDDSVDDSSNPVTLKHYFAVDLKAGDVLEVAASRPMGQDPFAPKFRTRLYNDEQEVLLEPELNMAAFLPPFSPVGVLYGDTGFAYVATEEGRYYFTMEDTQEAPISYQASAVVYRPKLGRNFDEEQVLFVDFDGATVDSQKLFGGTAEEAMLSPLRTFLAAWGLTPEDESGVIDAILAVMEQQLNTDLKQNGNNDRTSVKILNSRDHADPFGDENVSRVIIGGTIEELTVQTIGIAESIDPGNFVTNETGVVLLDTLSMSADEYPESINAFPTDGTITSKIDLIGRLVGSIASHEAGHFFANFHTENSNDVVSVMDQGGNLSQFIGLQDGQVYTPGITPLPGFAEDIRASNEGMGGLSDSLNNMAFGLSKGDSFVEPTPEPTPNSEPVDSGSDQSGAIVAGKSSSGGSGGALFWLMLFVPFILRRTN